MTHAPDIRTYRSTAATADEARRALAHLDHLTGTSRQQCAVAGPAEVYDVIGSCSQIATTLQPSLARLGVWLQGQEALGHLAAPRGPFRGDAEAAVEVSVQALSDARRACVELQAALERAQMAAADVEAVDRRAPARRSRWLRRR